MTAPTNISYNSATANFGIMTAEAVSALKDAAAKVARVYSVALEVQAGDTPANLEAVGSGFEVETGKGDDYVTYLGSINTILNAGDLPGFVAKLDRGG
ncbi:MAG: hypothetical protein KG075_17655 [Alphaproteobacteria bacterium]|nr:hypothetical protein [Alphaproteobacteria bacterium]